VRVPPEGLGPAEYATGHAEDPEALVESYGRTESNYEDARCRRVLLETPFFMSRFPVTNVLFNEFVADTKTARQPYATTAEQLVCAWVLDGQQWRNVQGACWQRLPHRPENVELWHRQPATCLSWHDGNAFTKWLNERAAYDAFALHGFAFRLPTEAEWEFACRAGTASPFWWGDTLDDQHAVHRCGGMQSRHGAEPVEIDGHAGRGRWNSWGLCDMSGNVWEWCVDVYDSGRPDRRVLRGGSWGSRSAPGRMLSFFRGCMPPDDVGDRNGLRVVYGPRLVEISATNKVASMIEI